MMEPSYQPTKLPSDWLIGASPVASQLPFFLTGESSPKIAIEKLKTWKWSDFGGWELPKVI
jgi:hypothetical protein